MDRESKLVKMDRRITNLFRQQQDASREVIRRERTETKRVPRKLHRRLRRGHCKQLRRKPRGKPSRKHRKNLSQLSSLRTAKSFGLVRATRSTAVAIVLVGRALGARSVVAVVRVRRWTRVRGRIVSSWR